MTLDRGDRYHTVGIGVQTPTKLAFRKGADSLHSSQDRFQSVSHATHAVLGFSVATAKTVLVRYITSCKLGVRSM
jgi:hypothetical protein